jgi:glycosyltransferase involved in cell wall biosynthesis
MVSGDSSHATVAKPFLLSGTSHVEVYRLAETTRIERKGLVLVMETMNGIARSDVKLLVVGGEASSVRDYTRRAVALGIGGQVVFVGRQTQVRPFLWLADAFVFPTAYEAFSLSILEATAAGLPLIVTRVHCVEDFASNH